MAGMRYIYTPVLSETIPDMISHLPSNLQTLCGAMRQYAKGHGIIAVAEETLCPSLDDADEWDLLVSDQRPQLGTLPPHNLLLRIMDHARDSEKLARSEAAWNCTVHSPLLDHAWYCSIVRDQVRCENITTAGIEPPTLVPSLTPSDSVTSKKADFAIALSLGPERERAFCQAGISALNQTEYEPVRYSPLALSIKTKVPGEGWDDAQLQMSTWMLAQMAKLKELCVKAGRPEARVPPLPVVVIQGHEWNFLCMEDCDSNVVSEQHLGGEKTASHWKPELLTYSQRLWKKIVIGSTATARGIYQILAALQHLMLWATKVYLPWLEEYIFEPLKL